MQRRVLLFTTILWRKKILKIYRIFHCGRTIDIIMGNVRILFCGKHSSRRIDTSGLKKISSKVRVRHKKKKIQTFWICFCVETRRLNKVRDFFFLRALCIFFSPIVANRLGTHRITSFDCTKNNSALRFAIRNWFVTRQKLLPLPLPV